MVELIINPADFRAWNVRKNVGRNSEACEKMRDG